MEKGVSELAKIWPVVKGIKCIGREVMLQFYRTLMRPHLAN